MEGARMLNVVAALENGEEKGSEREKARERERERE